MIDKKYIELNAKAQLILRVGQLLMENYEENSGIC